MDCQRLGKTGRFLRQRWDSISAFVMTLAHLYVANEETLRFFKAENVTGLPGYVCIGSVTL